MNTQTQDSGLRDQRSTRLEMKVPTTFGNMLSGLQTESLTDLRSQWLKPTVPLNYMNKHLTKKYQGISIVIL